MKEPTREQKLKVASLKEIKYEEAIEASKAVKSGKINKDMAARIDRMFDRTWQECASDWLEMFPRRTCKGSSVQECVADADRFRRRDNKEEQAAWDSLDRTDQDELLNIFFPPEKSYVY